MNTGPTRRCWICEGGSVGKSLGRFGRSGRVDRGLNGAAARSMSRPMANCSWIDVEPKATNLLVEVIWSDAGQISPNAAPRR